MRMIARTGKCLIPMAAAALFSASVAAQGSIIGLSPSGGAVGASGGGNDGLLFTPNTPISVSSLGFFDDGTADSVDVGIFQVSNSALLGSVYVSVSGANPGGFDFTSVTPIVLSAGTEYLIDSQSAAGTPEYVTSSADVIPAGDLAYNGYQYDYSPTLDIPTSPSSTTYFGPNFQFSPATAVPEPSLLTLGVTGLVAILARRRRPLDQKTTA